MSIRFTGCTFDPDARRLFRAGREVHISPKAFELLNVLIEARPRAVAKAELLERVWPSVFVSDASLARAVTELRDAIGDRTHHAIRTVHRYGYAFGADARPTAHPNASDIQSASYWLVSGAHTIALGEGEHLVSREPGADIWLDSPAVSRRHARVVVRAAQVAIEDLGSKNGTFVRGERISALVPLHAGDAIRIGPFTLIFRVRRAPARTVTEDTAR